MTNKRKWFGIVGRNLFTPTEIVPTEDNQLLPFSGELIASARNFVQNNDELSLRVTPDEALLLLTKKSPATKQSKRRAAY